MDAPMRKLWQSAKQSSFLKYGLPMLVLIVGGSFGLKEFRKLRYEVIDKRGQVDPEAKEEHYAKFKRKTVSVDDEYGKLQDDDIDAWRNIRGPRPWEESKDYKEMLRKHQEEDRRRAENLRKEPA